METGIDYINEERERQINEEGWTYERDDEYTHGQLAMAGASYALPPLWRQNIAPDVNKPPYSWPWLDMWWKPTPEDRIKELSKAGALIAAEIDRLLREKANNFCETVLKKKE